MSTFILIFAFIVSWLAICTSFLLVVAYRDRARQATEAANRNAGYWAQAEEKAELVEAHNERLGEVIVESQKTMGKMTEHAREALRLAQESQSESGPQWQPYIGGPYRHTCRDCGYAGHTPNVAIVFVCPQCGGHRVHNERDIDDVLNASEISE